MCNFVKLTPQTPYIIKQNSNTGPHTNLAEQENCVYLIISGWFSYSGPTASGVTLSVPGRQQRSPICLESVYFWLPGKSPRMTHHLLWQACLHLWSKLCVDCGEQKMQQGTKRCIDINLIKGRKPSNTAKKKYGFIRK